MAYQDERAAVSRTVVVDGSTGSADIEIRRRYGRPGTTAGHDATVTRLEQEQRGFPGLGESGVKSLG